MIFALVFISPACTANQSFINKLRRSIWFLQIAGVTNISLLEEDSKKIKLNKNKKYFGSFH